jgi:hypothetical protein
MWAAGGGATPKDPRLAPARNTAELAYANVGFLCDYLVAPYNCAAAFLQT